MVNPEVDPCVRIETEDVPVSLSVGDFHAVDHEEFQVLNFAPVQEGRGGVVVGRNDAVESRSLAERDDFGRRQPSVRVDRMYMGGDAVPAGFVVQLRSRVRRRGEFFCPRTFRKGDFQRPVGGAPCRRGHLDDGPPARIDPSGEIAGRGLRFADFETAACDSRPAAESRTFESGSPLVEDAEVQIARTRFARTEMLGYADLYDAFGYGERGVDRNIVLSGSSLA